ncbi:hypothetical protein [Aquimarina sp. MMG016]|uniref:hypothetical protein n=1 Tax=Aquimarina sp. MMG016 TaxID=2822690 RepID=UPI001B3A1AAF|nr:hypothetical protein [Aquimarina sp. MMG016]MBQ4820071.1 hypothetical protein [Aquimarina sp. MMG016]
MSTNKENISEEIDLGHLFKLIGDAFNKLFQFVGNIFKGLFHLLIQFLQFIRIHFLKFVIAGVVGIAIGWYLDNKAVPIYISSMIVEPNFNSVQQLYNNIDFYNELAKEGANRPLAGALKISDSLARTIHGVRIESFSDNTQKIRQFSEFIQELDTVSRKLVDYNDYLENFNDINSRFHKIEIVATDSGVAKECQNAIVRSIENNEYFRSQKRTNELNLRINDSVVRKQLVEVDSLLFFYQNLKMLEIQKPEGTSGTSINLAAKNQDLDRSEITLLKESKALNNEIMVLNQRKANTENIINVISDFPDKGVLANSFFNQKKVLLPILCIGLVFISLVLLSLNKYLKNYNETSF